MRRRLLKTLTTLALSVLMIVSVISAFVLGIGAGKPINALAEGEQTYTKVDLADIQSTDTIIIVSTKGTAFYAMSNDKGTSAAPTAVKVTVDNNTITTAATNILWNISKDGDNLIIYPADTTATWLYCTATNNGVRVGTNDNKTFTLDASGYLQNTETSRYLGVYNNADWRCYKTTTGNIAGQTFFFYKLGENAGGGSETECQHTNTTEVPEVPATCTTPGTTAGVVCSDCGTTISGCDEIPATGHLNTEDVAEVPATCTETGTTAGVKCTDCGAIVSGCESINALGHTYVDGVCTVCHEKQATTLTINRDSFGDVSTYAWNGWSATATTGETVLGKGYIYGNAKDSIQMNSKQAANYIYNSDALPGSIVSIKLTAASGTPREFDVLTSATAYDNTSGNLDLGETKQTVTTSGATWEFTTTNKYFAIAVTGGAAYLSSIEITYKVCSHTNTEAIGAAEEATCTEDGITAGLKCSDCGEILEAQATILATGHKDDDKNSICDVCETNLCTEHAWVKVEEESVAATCTEDGSEKFECSVCHQTKTETLSATGHTEVTDAAVDATCTTTGLTEGKHCSVCGEVFIAQTTTPIIDHTYVDGACTTCGKAEPVLPFKVGDVVIFTGSKADGTDTRELTGFADGAEYGTAEVYTDTLAGTFPITVVKGNQDGTYAFKNGDYFITCNGAKNVKLSTTLDNKSSWTVELVNGTWQIESCSNENYYLQYNPSSPRFTTYAGTQQPIKVIKVTDPVLKGVALALNKGVTVKVTYDVPELWLNVYAGAKVVFSNGQSFAATAGENVYDVDLTPAQINDDLTVKIQLADDTDFGSETDVSVSAYKAKVEAAGYEKLGYTEAKYNALIDLLDAALTYSQAADGTIEEKLSNDFAGVDDPTIVHANKDAKLFMGYAGTLSTYASVKVTVNTDNIQDGDTLVIKINDNEFYNGDFENYREGNLIIIDEIYPLNFNDTIYIEANEGSNATFTFNAYLKAVYHSTEDQKITNFAVATYLYGLAAEAFFALS